MKIDLPQAPLHWLLAILMLAGTTFLGFVPRQSDFGLLMLAALPCFATYAYLISRREQLPLGFYLVLAILARFILVFAFPQLSDDVYRFIWDGRLIVQGYNPFDHLPAYYLEAGHEISGLGPELFDRLNSPEYFTIYPPVAQATFAAAAYLFPDSITGSAMVLKLFLLACECGTVLLLPTLLQHFKIAPQRSLIYALNPLIMVEVMGNLHYEGAMIFFFLLSFRLLLRGRYFGGAITMALAIAAKLLPLLFLPFLIRRLGWIKSLRFFAVLGIALLLLFLPLTNGVFLQNFGSSLDLYFRKFEFNASVYYVARWIGFQLKGYNLIARIGPMLALGTFLGIMLMASLNKKRSWDSLPGLCLFAICLYLFFTTTVHPWYVALPLMLCTFTSWRFPVVWSGLAWLTYSNYSGPVYIEHLWVVALEYGLVLAFMVWEFRRRSIVPPAPAT